LWKSCGNVYEFIKEIRKQAGLRKGHIQHLKRKQRYLTFAFLRKKSYRKNTPLPVCAPLPGSFTQLITAVDEPTCICFSQHLAAATT
jgi:hypothetical protein